MTSMYQVSRPLPGVSKVLINSSDDDNIGDYDDGGDEG